VSEMEDADTGILPEHRLARATALRRPRDLQRRAAILTAQPDAIGPWAPGLTLAERLARLRSLRALVQVFAGASYSLVLALARAEAIRAMRRHWLPSARIGDDADAG
jgi:hypothetical protein